MKIRRKRRKSDFQRNREERKQRVLEGVSVWASFYRANPQRFVADYFGIQLKLFQQFLLYCMMHNNFFMYISSRGQGKTFLSAIYVCVRAVLYPGSKIIVAAGSRSQSREVIAKIDEIMGMAPMLRREIKDYSATGDNPRALFHNGSWIRTVTANDNARSRRANVLVIDEFRMVDESVLNTVLREFAIGSRQPKYLRNPEYSHLLERNQEIYLSSAWYKFHWSYKKLKEYFDTMVKADRKFFVAGFPYQLTVRENLETIEQVRDKVEEGVDPIEFAMERECIFYGESQGAYFNFKEALENRIESWAVYPNDVYRDVSKTNIKSKQKPKDSIRLLTCDIALLGGKNNDASAFALLELTPTKKGYDRTLLYIESHEGKRTDDTARRIRQLYDELDVDYIVLDTRNVGTSVYDSLSAPIIDPETGYKYEPLSCINDEVLEDRCMYPKAPKVIYAIKATKSMNSMIARTFKDDIAQGNFKFLITEEDVKHLFRNVKGYNKLDEIAQTNLLLPYAQTGVLINEMVNLTGEVDEQGTLTLREPRSGRKDRYSAVSYGNYIADLLEREYLQSQVHDDDEDQWDGLIMYSG